jgi:hypothetical protein
MGPAPPLPPVGVAPVPPVAEPPVAEPPVAEPPVAEVPAVPDAPALPETPEPAEPPLAPFESSSKSLFESLQPRASAKQSEPAEMTRRGFHMGIA